MGIECGCKINNCCHEIDKIVKENSSRLNHPYQTYPEGHRGEGSIILVMLIFIIIATIGLMVFIVNQI